MNELIHADIFFFIASIAVLVVTAILVVALIYFIRILRDAKAVSSKVKEETGLIAGDIDQLRVQTKKDGLRLKNFFKLFGGIYQRYNSNKKSK